MWLLAGCCPVSRSSAKHISSRSSDERANRHDKREESTAPMRMEKEGGTQGARVPYRRRRLSQSVRATLAGCGIAGLLSLSLALSVAAPTAASETPPAEGVGVVELSVTEMLSLLEAGSTSSEYLVTAYLDRIEAYDDELHSIVTLSPTALEQARELDLERAAGHLRGPLHGVPIVLKDNLATFDMPTSAGNSTMSTFQTNEDSSIVAALREAGAIILAKTNMSEFAYMSGSSLPLPISGSCDVSVGG